MNTHSAVSFAADVLVRVTLVLAVFGGAGWLLRRQSAALRHLVWSLAIAGCVAVPVISLVNPFTVPLLPARTSAAQPASAPALDPAPESTPDSPRLDRFASVGGGAAHATAVESTRFTSGSSTHSPNSTDSEASLFGPRATTVLLGAWLFGILFFLIRFTAGLAVIRRIVGGAGEAPHSWRQQASTLARRFGVTRSVRVALSGDIDMPFAFGVTRRVIVLPAAASEWTDERREAVLMHELAHFSRGDILMNALSQFARALYWFHPLAWIAAHRLRVEGERASDDVVLRGGALPSDYAEHLLDIVRSFGRPLPAPAVAMARRSDFEGRLLAILEPRERAGLSRVRSVAIGALSVAVLLPLSALSSTARAAAPTALAQNETPQTPAPRVPAQRDSLSSETAARPQTPALQAVQAGSPMAALIETLGDVNIEVRVAAVKSLGSLGDPRAIAALGKSLREDSDARVREAAAWALGEIDDAKAVPALLDALRTERVPAVREQVVHALGEIDDASAVAGISGAVKDPSAAVRREVAWALGELGEPSAAPALVSMAKDEDVEVRRRVAQALDDVKSDASFDALVGMAHDSDAEVRASAVNALGNLEDRRALPTLVDALKDNNADVRSHAADGIHNVPDLKRAPAALMDALNDVNADVRHNVANALGEIGDEAAVPALKKATSDSNAEVRRAAAEALSDIGGPDAITALMALIKDPDPEIRKIAVEALGKRR